MGITQSKTQRNTLQINKRTLQRRLQTEGVTFRSVLTDVRMGMAQGMLTQTQLPIAEIASRIGYADDKAFRKALKAAMGLTPSDVRERGES